MKTASLLLLIPLLTTATLCFADTAMDPNMKMDTTAPSSKFMTDMDAGMKKMDHDMSSAPMTGDTDHDFASMMVPHHQGAIDMAKAELADGKDPEMRHLAERIIADQQKEIKLMNDFLKKKDAEAKK